MAAGALLSAIPANALQQQSLETRFGDISASTSPEEGMDSVVAEEIRAAVICALTGRPDEGFQEKRPLERTNEGVLSRTVGIRGANHGFAATGITGPSGSAFGIINNVPTFSTPVTMVDEGANGSLDKATFVEGRQEFTVADPNSVPELREAFKAGVDRVLDECAF